MTSIVKELKLERNAKEKLKSAVHRESGLNVNKVHKLKTTAPVKRQTDPIIEVCSGFKKLKMSDDPTPSTVHVGCMTETQVSPVERKEKTKYSRSLISKECTDFVMIQACDETNRQTKRHMEYNAPLME